MGVPTLRYLSTLRFSEDWLAALAAAVPDVDVRQIPAATLADVPDELWAGVDVLHTAHVLPDPAVAPRLRWVQLDTAGVDHVVGHPVWASPIDITTIGGVSPVPMAEYVLMMVLAFSHHLPSLLAGQRRHDWPPPSERWSRYLPRALPGSTLVVLGYGRIGREVSRLARAFGMVVVGVRRTATTPPGTFRGDATEVVTVDQLDSVLPRCDYLVVTVPLTDETRGLLDADAFARLRPGAVLIDVARGGVVDEDAALDALSRGSLAGAAFDVFEDEPLRRDSPLWDHPAVIVTPHVAGFAPAYEPALLELVKNNLRRFAAGQPLVNLVDRERGY